jgi:hypothetical protein
MRFRSQLQRRLRLALAPAVAEVPAALAGVWRLKTFVSEDVQSGERKTVFGRRPNGCLVLTPSGRLFAILTARRRVATAPLTDADRIAAYDSIIAYSGTYHVEGTTFTTTVDIAWNEGWVGTDQVRHYRIEGNTLYIETLPAPNVDHGGRTMRFLLSWQREN